MSAFNVSNKDSLQVMAGPEENSEFCFPRISIEIKGKQNSLFPDFSETNWFVI